jgi:cytochrome c oxidase subunit 2
MSLSFGELQTVVLIAFVVIVVALVATFAIVARASRADLPADRVRDSAYRLRRGWLAFLVILLGAAVIVSLFELPYPTDGGEAEAGAEAEAQPDARVEVKVSGGQFYWSVSPPGVSAGSRLAFDVTSVDVNHGFGIYSPAGELIGNVQAMPGYHNKLELTVEEPGTYLISCLEFCGINHHEMTREFEVAP